MTTTILGGSPLWVSSPQVGNLLVSRGNVQLELGWTNPLPTWDEAASDGTRQTSFSHDEILKVSGWCKQHVEITGAAGFYLIHSP